MCAAALLVSVGVAPAQEAHALFSGWQIHGNLAQGMLFSSENNYMTAKSSDGSYRWTDGSLSLTRSITDKFRVGAQAHSYSLGQLGRQNVTLDWAYGDYKVNQHFGIRAGKVKTPSGLYNDVQDIDAVYPWALLPQSVYPADMRAFHLSHYGGVVYGEFALGQGLGTIGYQAFGGLQQQSRAEGFAMAMASQGLTLGDCSGPSAGVDVRWKLPVDGLTIGATYAKSSLSAPETHAGAFVLPLKDRYSTQQYYAHFEKNKIDLAAEWQINPTFVQIGSAPESYGPMRSWYGMASYHLTDKLTIGSYYGSLWAFHYGNRDREDPRNYLRDVAVNTRVDLNRFLYFKLEGHFMQGNGAGFYPQVNPDGMQKDTRLMLARVGFTF